MCAAKSPISALQELAMLRHLPSPQYDIVPVGSGFKCIGNIGGVAASAVAESKKRAKHLCAEHILQVLQSQLKNAGHCDNLTIINIPISQNPIVHVEKVHVNPNEPNFNAIGKLNELCSQNGILYPNYEEAGIREQKFVVICKLQGHTTQGEASTKKQAKQIAAGEMLSRVSVIGFTSPIKECKLGENVLKSANRAEVKEKVIQLLEKLSSKTQKHPPAVQTNPFLQTPRDEENERVIQMFKQLSNRAKNHLSKVETNPFAQSNQDIYPNFKAEDSKLDRSTTEQKIEKEEPLSEEELRNELQKLNVAYKISEFQRSPLVLILKTLPTKSRPPYTFLHSADTHEVTVLELLQKAVSSIKFMEK